MKERHERIKINGKLKSSLRKKSSEITYSNLVNSDYLRFDFKQKYIPKVLFFQIFLNIILFSCAIYFELIFFFVLIFINFFILWIYSLISILSNRFRDKTKKLMWTILILFIPISVYFYPDFKRIQTV